VLEEAGRKRCTMPFISAEDLHAYVYEKVMTRLGLDQNREVLRPLIEPERYQEAINRAAKTVLNWEKEVSRIKRARQNIYNLLEDEAMDKMQRNEFMNKLQANSAKLSKAENHLREAQNELDNLIQTRDNDAQLKQFVADNQQALKDIV
jgi:hypothetical protein